MKTHYRLLIFIPIFVTAYVALQYLINTKIIFSFDLNFISMIISGVFFFIMFLSKQEEGRINNQFPLRLQSSKAFVEKLAKILTPPLEEVIKGKSEKEAKSLKENYEDFKNIKLKLVLYSPAETIKEFLSWIEEHLDISTAKVTKADIKNLSKADKLFKSFRKDLGYNDSSLKKLELVRVFISDDSIKNYFDK